MNSIKIEKITVRAKSRKLNAVYTCEIPQEVEHHYGEEIESQLFKHMGLEMCKFTLVLKPNLADQKEARKWCKDQWGREATVRNKFNGVWSECWGDYYFQHQEPAALFRLRWC